MYTVLKILSSFSIQLLAAELMFCFFLKKRQHFWLRLIPTALLFILLTYDLPFYALPGWPSFRFILTFALSVIILGFCFEGSFASVLFCSIAGYASRSMGQNFFQLIRYLIPTMLEEEYDPLYYGVFLTLYIVLYFVLARKLADRDSNNIDIQNVKIILISGIVIILNEFLTMWKWVFLLPDNPICPLYGILSCTLTLLIQFQFFQEGKLATQNKLLEQLLMKERENYALSKHNIEMLNIHAHDIKHNVSALRNHKGGDAIDKYCDQLEEAASRFDDMPQTGNIALDTVIREIQGAFQDSNVEFTYFADGEVLGKLDETDIYSLFGNILSNALQCEKKEDPKDRFVSILVTKRANQIYIHADNFCSGSVTFSDGLPQTTQDGPLHGFGTKSIRYVVERYNGVVDFSLENKRFSVDILIPLI